MKLNSDFIVGDISSKTIFEAVEEMERQMRRVAFDHFYASIRIRESRHVPRYDPRVLEKRRENLAILCAGGSLGELEKPGPAEVGAAAAIGVFASSPRRGSRATFRAGARASPRAGGSGRIGVTSSRRSAIR